MIVELGALSESLAVQLEKAGFAPVSPESLASLQKDCDAITRCVIHGYIGEKACAAARKRVMGKLARLPLRKWEPAT